jgi:hypothetical protein
VVLARDTNNHESGLVSVGYIHLPTFLDVHSIRTLTEENLIKEQNALRDELGVKTQYSLLF